MNIIRYAILTLIIWALPSFVSAYFSPAIGSFLSYLTFGLLLVYYLIDKDIAPNLPIFVILGVSYYFIAALNYTGSLSVTDYSIMIIKYLIVIVCGAKVMNKTSLEDIYIILIFGSLSIIINTLFFPLYNANFSPSYGRFSGFYLNPNFAGALSLIGLALSFGIKNEKIRYLGFIIFTIGGFFTFSRYFLAMWVIVNLFSVFINRKNLWIPLFGALGLMTILVFGSGLQLNAERFNAIQSLFSGNPDTKTLQEDSRTDTWASYKNIIINKPIFGNGYGKLHGSHFGLDAGVHNTYLLIIGEAGIFPFLIVVGIYMFLLLRSFKIYKGAPHLLMLALVLTTGLLVTHNYFDKFSLLLVSIYLYIVLLNQKTEILNLK